MAVSGRFPLLLLLGVVAVVIQPTPEMVLIWVGICVAVTLLDILVAASPRRLDVHREPVGQVRLGAAGSTSLRLTSYFPPNIPIGRVSRIELGDGDLDRRIHVRPAVDLAALQFVEVLTKEAPAQTVASAGGATP